MPAPQNQIHLRDDLAQASPRAPLPPQAQLLLQPLKALIPPPLLASAKVPAQKVGACFGRVDQARLGRMQGQACRRSLLAQER